MLSANFQLQPVKTLDHLDKSETPRTSYQAAEQTSMHQDILQKTGWTLNKTIISIQVHEFF